MHFAYGVAIASSYKAELASTLFSAILFFGSADVRRTKVVGPERLLDFAGGSGSQSSSMTLSKILNVDEIADSGPIRRVPVGSEYTENWSFTGQNGSDDRNEVRRLLSRILAKKTGGVATDLGQLVS